VEENREEQNLAAQELKRKGGDRQENDFTTRSLHHPVISSSPQNLRLLKPDGREKFSRGEGEGHFKKNTTKNCASMYLNKKKKKGTFWPAPFRPSHRVTAEMWPPEGERRNLQGKRRLKRKQ